MGNVRTVKNEFLTRITDKSITIYAVDNTLPADGISTTTITATLIENNEAAVGMPIRFSTTSGVIGTSAITDGNGKATVTLTAPTNLEPAEVRASFGTGSDIMWAGTYIQFTEVFVDNIAPTATSVPVDGSTNIAITVSPVIIFSEAIDEDTLAGNVKLIPYGATEGLAATLTLSADKTKVTINPDVDLDNNAQYYFFIGAGVKDLAGNPISSAWSLSDKASHEFTTVAAHVLVTTKDITLKTGWNLISLPLIPTSNKTVDILSAIISKVNIIQYYDGNSWTSYSPVAGQGNLPILEDGKGYWIDMKENTTLTITGTEMPLPGSNMPLYQIKKGWNLIGFKSVSEMKSSAYLSGVSYVVVYSYDGTSKSYPTVAYPSSDPAQTTDNNMKPGLGYWLYAKEEGYIVPVIK